MLIPRQSCTLAESLLGCISCYSATYVQEGAEIEYHLRTVQPVLRELLKYIESIEFSVEVGLASGISLYKRYLDENPKVQELKGLCKERSIAVFLLGHMLDLVTRKFDPQYRNPLEDAMVTYLYCITSARTDLTKSAVAAARMMKGTFHVGLYISKYLS